MLRRLLGAVLIIMGLAAVTIGGIGVSAFGKFKKTIYLLAHKDYRGASSEMLDSKWARTDTPGRAKELSDRLANVQD